MVFGVAIDIAFCERRREIRIVGGRIGTACAAHIDLLAANVSIAPCDIDDAIVARV